MQIDLTTTYNVARGSAFACLRNERQADIEAKVQRDWDRHPELRAQYGSIERYRVACRQWVYA